MSKKIKLFILVSIVLNLLFIGIFIGNSIHHYSMKNYHNMKHSGLKRGDRIIQLVNESSIAEPQKKILIEKLNEALSHRKNREQKKFFRRNIQKQLRAEPFDKEAYREAISGMINYRFENKLKMSSIMADVAQSLNKNEREQLSAILKRGRKR